MLKSKTGGVYPNIYKERIGGITYGGGDGWLVLTVSAQCNDALLVTEIVRYAMDVYGVTVRSIYQTDWDVEMATEHTDQVSVAFTS